MQRIRVLITAVLLLGVSTNAAAVALYVSDGFSDAIACTSCRGSVSDSQWGATHSVATAEQFVLGSDVLLNGLNWVGSAQGATSFTVNLFNTQVDGFPTMTPFASILIGDAFTSFQTTLASTTLFSADVPELTLFANVPYYISIVASSPGNQDWTWYSGSEGDRYAYSRDGAEWSFVNPDYELRSYAFMLNGSTQLPTPGVALLFATGLILLGVCRRTRGERH